MINANTRRAYARLANETVGDNPEQVEQFGINSNRRFQATLAELLRQVYRDGFRVQYLQGDGQLSFNSRDTVARVYRPLQITFTPFLRTPGGQPVYSTEGIINRLMRTLKDLNEKMGFAELRNGIPFDIIRPRNLDTLINTYNRTVNKALYQLTKRKLAPVDITPEGERWLAAQTEYLNDLKRGQVNFYLPVGTRAQVEQYRDNFGRRRSRFLRGTWEVVRQDKNKVLLTNGTDRVQVARSMVFPRGL
jgi:hypothetical protein